MQQLGRNWRQRPDSVFRQMRPNTSDNIEILNDAGGVVRTMGPTQVVYSWDISGTFASSDESLPYHAMLGWEVVQWGAAVSASLDGNVPVSLRLNGADFPTAETLTLTSGQTKATKTPGSTLTIANNDLVTALVGTVTATNHADLVVTMLLEAT